ncbi:MAG: YIP1 family protein [Archaeoglobus sp.]|uniref:Yip1 family protein n=1 Tax=Archaeoglobus sp. TaxID=1872626 RepID=UPI001DADF60D|nr:YIP1 family protein [Archaeoglobus sp.]MBO8179838.1 YIP1 family protein [Archaeoglobus sp.]
MEVITNPDSFLRKRLDKGFGEALAIVIVAAVISSLASYVVAPVVLENVRERISEVGTLTEEQIEAMLNMTYYGMLISPFITTLVLWLIISVVLHILSALFGGEGSFGNLAKLVAYSYIPVIILSPISIYLSYETTQQVLYGLKSSLLPNTILGIATTLWQAVYWTFAVKNARNLDLRNSAIAAGIVFIAYILLTMSSLIFSFLSGTP